MKDKVRLSAKLLDYWFVSEYDKEDTIKDYENYCRIKGETSLIRYIKRRLAYDCALRLRENLEGKDTSGIYFGNGSSLTQYEINKHFKGM